MTADAYKEIAAQIRPALTQLYVLYFRMSENSDLTGPQLTIMSRLEQDGPSRISHIAKAEGIRMPTASNALHQLENRGMIERIREESDRRGVKVALTDFGRQELARVGEERIDALAKMLSTLSPERLADTQRAAAVIEELAAAYTSEFLKNNED